MCTQLPDELLLHALSHLACSEPVPGSVDDGPTFKPGEDALVLGKTSRAAHAWKRTLGVSRRWRELAMQVTPWTQLREMDNEADLNWELLRVQSDDPGHKVWAASSTSREEGKQDKWYSVSAPGGDRSVILVRKCNEEGVSYDVVRWMGCLQAMHHPCIAALHLARASHNPEVSENTSVHAGMEWVDTSVQKIVYGTLERTSHTVFGRALPPLMLRSFVYQLLHALACCHARGIAHGNLAPYRILAKTLDAARDQYLLKVGDFGFSPPFAALCNEELPIRPSRASPELHADHKFKRYGSANDIWALGTVFAEMTCGNRDPTVYVMIQELDVTSEETMTQNLPQLCNDGRDLMRKMLRAEPMDRISAADALCHPYFDGLHDQCEVVARYLPLSMPPPTRFLDVRVPKQWSPGTDFLASQPHLNAKMWTILYDWLAVVSFKFKFVPRSLQLACDFMLRYMSQVKVERKALQLVGIGALCLACKHEEVMIPNMNDFIFICDSAYTLQELMVMEVDILTTLQVQLHMPTAHDMLLPMLIDLGEAPEYPDAKDFSPLRSWCEAMLLLGQAHYNVVLHDPATLARCVGTLGGLLSKGVTGNVILPDGTVTEGKRGSKQLHERVCFLKPGVDWECMAELLNALELSVKESREMLVKCHAKFVELNSLKDLLEKYRGGERKASHLTQQDVRPLLDKHYPTEFCESQNAYLDKSEHKDEDEKEDKKKKDKKAYFKSGKGGNGKADAFSIITVTLAIGKQLMLEHQKVQEQKGMRA